LGVVTIIGASTAFVMASIGLVQNDIKRVIAYSTCSQLGYMFFAIGVSAYGAAIFHLFTHAFFKALLFLGAGSVIHALADEQDMRKMGGIYKLLPLTYVVMWIGSLSLTGIPFFAGVYSKEISLEAAWGAHSGIGNFAFLLGIAAAAMTAFYSWRLLFMTFHGAPRASEDIISHVHESPKVMTIPLIFLAIGAVFSGILFSNAMVGEATTFWGDSILVLHGHDALEAAHHAPLGIKLLPLVVALLGIFLAWYLYIARIDLPARLVEAHGELHRFLLNKWYFDEMYDVFLVRPAKFIGYSLWRGGDGRVIDGLGPDGVAASVLSLARRATRLQTGYVYHYAFAMLIGVAVFVTWFFYTMLG
jgi:NADH-quinone oxidoreductase subunit L